MVGQKAKGKWHDVKQMAILDNRSDAMASSKTNSDVTLGRSAILAAILKSAV